MSVAQEPARRARSISVHRFDAVNDVFAIDVAVSQVLLRRQVGTQSERAAGDEASDAEAVVELPASATSLVVEFVSKLQERLAEQGEDSLDGVDVIDVADRLIASVPSSRKSEWDQLVGPFYDTSALATWKGMSRQRLSVLRQEGRLLGLRTADGEVLHPSFQFDADGGLLPHLSELQSVLSAGIEDEWTRALWLNTPLEVWGGKTAAQMLRQSADDALTVLRMAEQDVSARTEPVWFGA